jgi:protoporphyrinogen oxidase
LNVVLRLKEPFHEDNSYWLSINDRKMPFLAVVEHTNFMDISHYDGESLLYIGNYLTPRHKYFDYSLDKLIDLFMPHLKKLNANFSKKDIIKGYKLPGYFAQPIIPLNYSDRLPKFNTPIEGLYLNNMQQVYPWDRGTNYSVANSKAVSQLVIGER